MTMLTWDNSGIYPQFGEDGRLICPCGKPSQEAGLHPAKPTLEPEGVVRVRHACEFCHLEPEIELVNDEGISYITWNRNSLIEIKSDMTPFDSSEPISVKEPYELLYSGDNNIRYLCELALTTYRKSLLICSRASRISAFNAQIESLLSSCRPQLYPAPHYSEEEMKWTGLPGNRTINLAYFREDRRKMKGLWGIDPLILTPDQYDLHGYDEITEITEFNYLESLKFPAKNTDKVSTCSLDFDDKGQWVMRRWENWLNPHCSNKLQSGEILRFPREKPRSYIKQGGTHLSHRKVKEIA